MILPNLDLDTLRTLVVAYDLGGFGQAAERLGRTPSAISLQMKRLQQEVGATLFYKSGRNLALTEVGELVLGYARRILELNDELLDKIRGASLKGQVKLGFTQDFAETVLPQALSRFIKCYPLIQIELRIDGNAALVNAVENGQLDLALTIGHAELKTAYHLGELQLVWIAGQEFSAHKDQLLPIVALGPQCMFRKRMLNVLEQANTSWRMAAVSPSLAGLWAAAIAGLGVTMRGNIGLPNQLVADERLFNLPTLGAFPITLHRRIDEKSEIVGRLTEIISELVKQVIN
ncbi:MAG: LysR family transcriptional regulator [Acidobacteria bacterium]|nr:LysR family transcriptional regulator [Acidobacteriota bacterium]